MVGEQTQQEQHDLVKRVEPEVAAPDSSDQCCSAGSDGCVGCPPHSAAKRQFSLVDTRAIGRPKLFMGAGWMEWRYKMMFFFNDAAAPDADGTRAAALDAFAKELHSAISQLVLLYAVVCCCVLLCAVVCCCVLLCVVVCWCVWFVVGSTAHIPPLHCACRECVSRRSSLACVWLKRIAIETVRVSW